MRHCSSAFIGRAAAGWSELLPLRPSQLAALRQQQLDAPLVIQRAAAPRILSGESVAVHAQTGSGKTLAFLLPLLARCRQGVPRQVLVVVPSHQLALQTLEVSEDLQGPSDLPIAELLRNAKPAQREQKLLQQRAPFLIMTAGQLACADGHVLERLRESLHAVVIDEPDMVLAPPANKLSLRRRSRRNKWLHNEPTAQALQILLERRRSSVEHSRVQLVLLSATITKMRLRDIQTVVNKRAGRIGLVVAGSATSSASESALALTPTIEQLLQAEPDGGVELVHAGDELGEGGDGVDRSHGLEGGEPPTDDAVAVDAREGFGVRGGVLRVPMPGGLRHLVALCDEQDKAEAVKRLMQRLRPKLALLVVRDGLEPAQVRSLQGKITTR